MITTVNVHFLTSHGYNFFLVVRTCKTYIFYNLQICNIVIINISYHAVRYIPQTYLS